MKLKANLFGLAVVGVLGLSVQFAQAEGRSVAIKNLKLVQEKGAVAMNTGMNHHHHHHHFHGHHGYHGYHGYHGHHGGHHRRFNVEAKAQVLPSPQVNKG